jgi:hypothetical protein
LSAQYLKQSDHPQAEATPEDKAKGRLFGRQNLSSLMRHKENEGNWWGDIDRFKKMAERVGFEPSPPIESA